MFETGQVYTSAVLTSKTGDSVVLVSPDSPELS